MAHFLDFEKPLAGLEAKIEELRHISEPEGVNIADELVRLNKKADLQLKTIYSKLTAWQKTQVARHPDRPKAKAFMTGLTEDFTPLAGDRAFADDAALLGGIGWFKGRSVVVLGTEKGTDTETRIRHNFGMARPEGYRKAQRLINLATQFNLPVIAFVDTAGAFPGVEAEARGQAEAIAKSIEVMLEAPVPVVAVITGEGGSGGAIALAAANKVFMLEHAVYSVISPEGCASILWRSAASAPIAAEALRLTAQDIYKFKLIDEIIPEPTGGAHRDPAATIAAVGRQIDEALTELDGKSGKALRQLRREKFLAMGRNLPV